jgi:hypothetical protein
MLVQRSIVEPSNEADLMCTDGPKSAAALNFIQAQRIINGYLAKKP